MVGKMKRIIFFKSMKNEDAINNYISATLENSNQKDLKGLLFRESFHPLYLLESQQFHAIFSLSISYGF